MGIIKVTRGISRPWTLRFIFWLQRRKNGAEFESARLRSRTPYVFLALTRP